MIEDLIDLRLEGVRLSDVTVATDTTPNRRWRPWVENILGFAILVGTGWALWRRRATFAELLDASWSDLGWMAALIVVGFLLSAAQSWVLFRAERAPIGFGENLLVVNCANFANYLPMRVGTVLRGRYMKQVHGLRYARFGSVFGIRTVLLVCACGLLGTVGTLGLWLFEGRAAWLLLALFVGMGTLALVALLFRLPTLRETGRRLPRIWNDFVDGFARARAQPRISSIVLGLMLLQQLTVGLRLAIGFEAFQTQTSVWLILLLAPLVMVVSFFAFTPGGLGIREAAIGYVTFATGYDFNLGLFAGSLDRVVILVITALLGPPSFLYVWKRLGSDGRYDGSPTDSRTGSRSRASLR
jgi:uncharacterized membrane protein YbhN (UPF0104 family)